MKISSTVLLILALVSPGISQTDSLADAMPLVLGNSWTYAFSGSSSLFNVARSYSTTGGYATFRVLRSIQTTDSTIWTIAGCRDYSKSYYNSLDQWVTDFIHDSVTFEIVEMNSGNHELRIPVATPSPGYPVVLDHSANAFPFWTYPGDTSRFYRYVPFASGDSISFDSYRMAGYQESLERHVKFIDEVGVVKSSGTHAGGGYILTWAYYLHFHPAQPPSIELSPMHLTFTTNPSVPKDATVTIRNNGLQCLSIQTVTSVHPHFGVVSYPTAIHPLDIGTIILRYVSTAIETAATAVVIQSNSSSSPDTVWLEGRTVDGTLIVGGDVESSASSIVLNTSFPNPFPGSTQIGFNVPMRAFVSLRVFDLLGREVASIADDVLDAGYHTRTFNAQGLSGGIYLCRLQVGTVSKTLKLLLTR